MDSRQKKELAQIGVDWNKAMNNFAGQEEIYYNLIRRFPEDEYYGILKEKIENGNYEDAFKAAHSLKGICSSFGFRNILDQLDPLVELLRNEPYARDAIEVYMKRLQSRYAAVLEAVRNL